MPETSFQLILLFGNARSCSIQLPGFLGVIGHPLPQAEGQQHLYIRPPGS